MTACVAQRVWRRIEITDTGCWLFTGALVTGYGRIGLGDTHALTHRVMYELLVGPVPEGMDLDHLCRRRACCNPRHLEPVTRRENLLRGETLTAAHAASRDCGFAGCKSCARFRVAS